MDPASISAHQVVFVESGCEERRRSKRMMACPDEGHRDCYCCTDGFQTPPRKPKKSPKKSSPNKNQGTRKAKRRNLAEVYRQSPACEAPKREEDEEEEEEEEEEEVEEVKSDVSCQECRTGSDPQKLLLCDGEGCKRGYHMYCLSPILVAVPKGDWFCPHCSKNEREVKVFPKVKRSLIDFFRIQDMEEPVREVKKRRHSSSLGVYKKRRKLLPYTPSKSFEQRMEQMHSLASAMTTAGIEFSNELTYGPDMAPRSANQAKVEKGGMQVISKEDKATYELCKAMCLRGELPPLIVTRDPRQGFVVEASSHIKDMTFICEYTGDVDYMINREDDEGDSMMGLLFPEDPAKELVICPDKRGNIARFISGINNHTPEGRKKQNLRCIRFDIDGEVHALLVSIRDIAKGERLYYDYNAYQKEYPTEHFE